MTRSPPSEPLRLSRCTTTISVLPSQVQVGSHVGRLFLVPYPPIAPAVHHGQDRLTALSLLPFLSGSTSF